MLSSKLGYYILGADPLKPDPVLGGSTGEEGQHLMEQGWLPVTSWPAHCPVSSDVKWAKTLAPKAAATFDG